MADFQFDPFATAVTESWADKWEREYTTTRLKWDRRFVTLAREIAKWSKDPSSKVGCVITDDREIVATGYNGFAANVNDSPARYTDRDVKYKLIVHADMNAILQAAKRGTSVRNCTMYLTGPPCNECVKGIIQAGIDRVVWPEDNPFENDEATKARWASSIAAANLMLTEAKVELTRIKMSDDFDPLTAVFEGDFNGPHGPQIR